AGRQIGRLDPDPGLLVELPDRAVDRPFAMVQQAFRQAPAVARRLTKQQQTVRAAGCRLPLAADGDRTDQILGGAEAYEKASCAARQPVEGLVRVTAQPPGKTHAGKAIGGSHRAQSGWSTRAMSCSTTESGSRLRSHTATSIVS